MDCLYRIYELSRLVTRRPICGSLRNLYAIFVPFIRDIAYAIDAVQFQLCGIVSIAVCGVLVLYCHRERTLDRHRSDHHRVAAASSVRDNLQAVVEDACGVGARGVFVGCVTGIVVGHGFSVHIPLAAECATAVEGYLNLRGIDSHTVAFVYLAHRSDG